MESKNMIDTTMLDNLSQFLTADKLQALMTRYIEDSMSILEQLSESLSNNNAEETRRLVHSLKSTSANVGANQLSALAAELEELARQEQLDSIRTKVNELNQVFESSKQSIQNLEIMRQQVG